MKVLTWYCPTDGLEHRCLLVAGWMQEHTLYIDGVLWVKMRKTEQSVLITDVAVVNYNPDQSFHFTLIG